MGVPVGGIVHVDVEETGSPSGWESTSPVSSWDSRRAAAHGISPRFEVPAGLQPPVQALVQVDTVPATPHHHSRAGDVFGPGPLVEGTGQCTEVDHDARPGTGLALVAGH